MPALSPIASSCGAAAAAVCPVNSMPRAARARRGSTIRSSGNSCWQSRIHCGWNWKTTSRLVMCSPSPISLIQSCGRFEPTRTRCPAREAADVVSDDGQARPVLDQVDLELGMVVPAAQRAGVVVHMPAGRGAGHRRHEFAGGCLSDQSTGLND